MNTNEEAPINVPIKSKDSDELSGTDSSTKPPSPQPVEVSTGSSRGEEKREGAYDNTSRIATKPSEPDHQAHVPEDKEKGNLPDTISNGDASQEIKINNDESKPEVVDFKSKNCDDNQSKMPEEHDRDDHEEEDLANSEVEVYSERGEDDDDEEEYTEDDEYVPFRNRRRYFSDSDEEKSFDEDGEGIDKKDSSHEGLPQRDTESDQDLSQVEGVLSDSGKKTEVDGVGEKLKRINRRDPTFVPRQGAFFMHDARDATADEEETARHQPPGSKPPGGRAGITSRWSHDLYNEKEQQPRSTNEIIHRYGCDIREIDIDQINDLMSPPFMIKRPSNNPRGRFYRQSQHLRPKPDSVTFEDNSFPSLQEVEKLYHRRRGGFTFSWSGKPPSRSSNIRNNDLPRSEVLQSSQRQSQIHQIPGNNHPENEGTHPNSRNHPRRRQDFHWGSNHGNLNRRPGVDVPARNSNSKRYSSNRPRYDEDTQSERIQQQQQQQPTQLVVIRNQPDQSQIHRNNRSYNRNNSNRGGQRVRQTGKKPFYPQYQAGQEKVSTVSIPEKKVPVGPGSVSAPRNNE